MGFALVVILTVGVRSFAQDTIALVDNHPANAETEAPIGVRAPDSPLTMAVTLQLRDRLGADRLLKQIQDPASPSYHHWLTSAEFAALFDPAQGDVDAVVSWLTGEGFTILSSSRTQRLIRFTGTVAQAQRTFHTTINNYGSGKAYGNLTDPVIPTRFAGLIANVHGLDNMRAAKASSHFIPRFLKPPTRPQANHAALSARVYASLSRDVAATDAVPAGASPNATIGGEPPAFGPADFLTFYDETSLANNGINGSGGDCIAIVSDSDFEQSSINAFNTMFAEPASNITTVLADESDPGFNGDEQEALLDLEWSHAVAPGAATRFYEGNDNDFVIDPIIDAIGAAVSDNLCGVISVSFTECGGSKSFYTGTVSPIYVQAALQEQSIFIAEGDEGTAGLVFDSKSEGCVPGSSRHVSELSTDPNVTAVGGVSFDPDFDGSGNDTSVVTGTTLRVWNDPNDGIPSGGAGGGGKSIYYGKPSYQTGLGVPADGKRDVPDVSLLASPNFPGAWTYMDGDCFDNGCDGFGTPVAEVFGGTSLSTPAWAGIAKLIAQQNNVTRLGPLNPVLYKLANSTSYGTVFADVTTGNNNFNGVKGYNAGPGFDQASGWGNPDINELAGLFFADVTPLGPSTLTLSPKTLSFGKVDFAAAGSASKVKTLTIINPAKDKATAVIDSIAGSPGFTVPSSCNNVTIDSGKKLVCDITYTPTGLGAVSGGELTITSNAGDSPGSVTLKGTGIQGTLTATPGSLNFTKVALSTTSAAKTVTLKNKTDSTFTISGITNSNPAFVPSGCVGTLAADSDCTITVTYTPTATAKVTDTLTITDDAKNSPQTVKLTGTGE